MVKKLFVVFAFFYSLTFFGQQISGTLQDEEGNSLMGMLQIMQENDTTQISEFSRIRSGVFDYHLKNNYDVLRLKFVAQGYEAYEFRINQPEKSKNYPFDIKLKKMETVQLQEILVEAKRKPFIVKEDTISYRVEAYADGTERKIIDIIKNLPGINVDDHTGRITYNGKDIETVMLSGSNLFGSNYSLGTKQINVDIVDAVEVIENFEENPIFREHKRSDKVALNLSLKENMVDFSVDFGLGIGLFEDGKAALANSLNAVTLTQKLKNFGGVMHNNLGANNSPYAFGGGNENTEMSKYLHMMSPKIIQSDFLSNHSLGERANIND